jgi:uncharacterized protein (DUF952 family)
LNGWVSVEDKSQANMAEPIYHLVLRSLWEHQPETDYQADSLATEGFIHCSFAHQVAWAANRFYTDASNLLVLTIDPARLTSELSIEPPSPSSPPTSPVFPHIHGPLARAAVVAVSEMKRDGDGQWIFST